MQRPKNYSVAASPLNPNMFVIKYQKLFLGLSLFFVIASVVSVSLFGLKWGIDFTGGSLL